MGILSAGYRTALSVRKFFYGRGLRKTGTLPRRVISIGNLTLGGTGKTPAVIAASLEARRRGLHPCVLTRGYKGRAKGPVILTTGDREILDARQAGDEAVMMAHTLNSLHIPVIKGKDRLRAGQFALRQADHGDISLFILDDGFQHWRLHRDSDVLLIDASNPFGNGRLFPEGILREPVSSIERADIVVITKADMVSRESLLETTQTIRLYLPPDVPLFTATHKATSLVDQAGETRDLETLRNRPVAVFSGIANSSYFNLLLQTRGARIQEFTEFRDHHTYTQREMDALRDTAKGLDLITTEKDLVKLKGLALPRNIFALRIEFSVDQGFYDHLFGPGIQQTGEHGAQPLNYLGGRK